MKDRVCAVIVTYNRKELLLECLEALRKQTRPIQGIYLIDNASTDGTPQLLLDKGYIRELPPENLSEPWEKEFEISNLTDGKFIKLHYVRMHENVGGAGGFYEGVKRGYEKGYDWLWLMDDDAEPKEDALEILLANDSENTLCLCPVIVNRYTSKVQNYHHKIINFYMLDVAVVQSNDISFYKGKTFQLQANAFVGPLVKREAIELAGFPNPKLFIWGDDTEYTYRISKFKKIILVGSSIIYHKDIALKDQLNDQSAKKIYFYFRNKIYFIRSYSKYNLFGYIFFAYKAFRQSLALFIKHKKPYTISIIPIKGYIDGFKFKV